MKKSTHITPVLLLFAFILSLLPKQPAAAGPSAVDETINRYRQYEQGIYDRYTAEASSIEQTYRRYRRIIKEEYKAYEREILKRWPSAETSTAKKWVEYSQDYRLRRIVDFKNGYIRLDLQVKKGEDIDTLADQELRDMVLESPQTAFKRNRLLQNIERRITNDIPGAITGNPDKSPVLLQMVTGRQKPTNSEIDAALAIMKQRATVSRNRVKAPGTEIVSMRFPLPSDSLKRKAMEYRPVVKNYANRRGLSEALVLAVIHTESAFNPLARSRVPAYGLMQIVPGSAGMDASKLLFGRPVLLSPSYLYGKTNNINVGTAYLYLLYYRYLGKIKNPTSRLYCAIAAYNTGPGNVARAFTGSTNINQAAKTINLMSPDEVYQHLLARLPTRETRDYLKKVTGRIAIYQ